ncbi:MAG: MlaE family ABC transporter permease [Bacteriovoracia bacterium]
MRATVMSAVQIFLVEFGSTWIFIRDVLLAWILNFKKTFPLVVNQITNLAIRSLSTVAFSGFFIGSILVMQFNMMLSQYDAQSLLGGLNTSSTLREVGPLMISFLLAGKVGAFTTAELATMSVTEQFDAIRCLGKDPIEYVIVPRFIAIVVCSLFLLGFGLFIGVVGSMFIADVMFEINVLQYISTISRFLSAWTIVGGGIKSFVYGLVVASVSTYKGYKASGGARGVGKAVTESAVFINLFIIFANAFTSVILDTAQDLTSEFFKTYWGGR